jgi:hypothetical protein
MTYNRHNVCSKGMRTETQNNYSLPLDAVLLCHSILARLDAGKVATFDDRLRSQKVQYLAQVFGVSPAYSYNLYIRGPYSPALANDLYTLDQAHVKPDTSRCVPDELEERLGKLKEFIEGKSIRQLELVATMHWLLNKAQMSVGSARDMLSTWKEATPEEVHYAEQEIHKII